VLAVVEDDQGPPAGERLRHRVGERSALALADAQGRGDGLGEQVGRVERRQLDQPDAVGEAVGQAGDELERQPRLAAAGGTDQGQQPAAGEELTEMGQLLPAPDELVELGW
jgi:hypothetical protein